MNSGTQNSPTNTKSSKSQGESRESAARANTSANSSSSANTGGESNTPSTMEAGSTASLSAAIAEGLGLEDQQVIDRGIKMVKKYFDSAKQYVSSNPKEATTFVAVAGIAAWAVLFTKPGQAVFKSGKEALLPQLSKWLQQNVAKADLH